MKDGRIPERHVGQLAIVCDSLLLTATESPSRIALQYDQYRREGFRKSSSARESAPGSAGIPRRRRRVGTDPSIDTTSAVALCQDPSQNDDVRRLAQKSVDLTIATPDRDLLRFLKRAHDVNLVAEIYKSSQFPIANRGQAVLTMEGHKIVWEGLVGRTERGVRWKRDVERSLERDDERSRGESIEVWKLLVQTERRLLLDRMNAELEQFIDNFHSFVDDFRDINRGVRELHMSVLNHRRVRNCGYPGERRRTLAFVKTFRHFRDRFVVCDLAPEAIDHTA